MKDVVVPFSHCSICESDGWTHLGHCDDDGRMSRASPDLAAAMAAVNGLARRHA